jgi:hypothetical protein
MRHVLTVEEKIRGLRAALASRKTPSQLRPALRRHLRSLESGKSSISKRDRGGDSGFLGFFKL